jgi:hypothetical protein
MDFFPVPQFVLNWAFLAASGVIGWLVGRLTLQIKELQNTDAAMAKELHEVALLIAGKYVRRDELADFRAEVMTSLNAIQAVLREKADK